MIHTHFSFFLFPWFPFTCFYSSFPSAIRNEIFSFLREMETENVLIKLIRIYNKTKNRANTVNGKKCENSLCEIFIILLCMYVCQQCYIFHCFFSFLLNLFVQSAHKKNAHSCHMKRQTAHNSLHSHIHLTIWNENVYYVIWNFEKTLQLIDST